MERIYQGEVVLDRNYTINIIYIIIYIILKLSAKRNLKMQMSKVGNRESGKAAEAVSTKVKPASKKMLYVPKIIRFFLAQFRKNLYLCIIDAKMT